jgi:hypothetical protein
MEDLIDLQSVRPPAKVSEIELSPEASSLDLLRAIYRCSSLPLTTRMRAAIAALPFELPKLAVTAVLSREEDYAALLDQRLNRARANGMLPSTKVIEHQPDGHRRRV